MMAETTEAASLGGPVVVVEDYSLGSADEQPRKEEETTTTTTTEHHHHEHHQPSHHQPDAQHDDSHGHPSAPSAPQAISIPVLPLSVSLIEVAVLNGEKKGDGLGAYQTYHVRTKTSLPEFKKQEFTVERRFSDFIWLFDNLGQNHRGVIIPPAPEKETSLIQDPFSQDFVESRRRKLERFLRRVVTHPSLASSKTLQTFLEAPESEFQTAKAPPTTGVWGSLFGASKKIASNISHSISGYAEVDPWFEEKTRYFNNLETHLFQLSTTVAQTVRKCYELSFNNQEFGVCSTVISQTETGDKDLTFSFEKLGDVMNQIHALQKELAFNGKDLFEDDVKDYHKLISAVKSALAFRTEKLGEFQSATKDHTGKKEKLQQLRDSGKPVTPAMETDLQKAEQLVNERKVIFETTSSNVRAEVERFMTLKSKELQAAVSRLIQINLTYELRVVDLWKKFLSALPEQQSDD